jgi:hypothetical protein
MNDPVAAPEPAGLDQAEKNSATLQKLPRQEVRVARTAAVVSTVALATFTIPAALPFCLSPFIGGLAALAATISAATALLRNRPSLPDHHRYPIGRLAGLLLAGTVLLVAHFIAFFLMAAVVREVSKASVTSANLRGICAATQAYSEDLEVLPASLDDLLNANMVTPKGLYSLGDPGIFQASLGTAPYSSFVYQPPRTGAESDPHLIIAFERQPWTRRGVHLFPSWNRQVIFADGHVEQLAQKEFDAALKIDDARRQQPGTRPAQE